MTLKLFIHGLMLAFAGASFFNVKAYIINAGHDEGTAIALGLALSFALVGMASMLTHISKDSSPKDYNTVLYIGLGLAFISGYLQASEYMRHLSWFPAVLLGFGIPMAGEVGVAFGYSAFAKARERERFRSISLTVEKSAADILDNAIARFDPTAVEQHVARNLNGLVRSAVSHSCHQAGQFYAQPAPAQPNSETVEPVTAAQPEDAGERVNTGTDGTFNARRDELNNKRRQQAAQRQDALWGILRDQLNGQPTDALNKTALGTELGTTRQTIGNDLEALEQAGRLRLNGHIEVIS